MNNNDDFKDLHYQLYKQARKIIDKAQSMQMNYDDFLFLHELKNRCEHHDSHDRTFLNRWLSEQL